MNKHCFIDQDAGQILKRQRVNDLLKESLDYSLVTVVAGPSYGKSTTVASFLEDADFPVVWIQLFTADNDVSRFWDKVIEAVYIELPDVAEKLKEIGFPGTSVKFSAFTGLMSQVIESLSRLVVVVDDVHCIENPALYTFFNRTMKFKAEDEKFCRIMISKNKIAENPENYFAIESLDPYMIIQNDLAFREEEIIALFQLHGVHINESDAKKIYDQSGGWLLLINMLLTQRKSFDLSSDQFAVAAELFRNQYFANYTKQAQKLLLKLSILPLLTPDLIKDFIDYDIQECIHLLINNVFIDYNYLDSRIELHPVYKKYLASQSYVINNDEKNHILEIAADYYQSNHRINLALDCYLQCGNYNEFMNSFLGKDNELSTHVKENLMLLDRLPGDFVSHNLYVDFSKALLYILNLQTEEAMKILDSLVTRLEKSGSSNQLLGEVYLSLSEISIYHNNIDGVDYIKKALKLLPDGSRVFVKEKPFVNQNRVFFLPKDFQGNLEALFSYIREFASYYEKACNGRGYGFDLLFESEGYFNIGHMVLAENRAFQAILKASTMNQFDIVFNAYYILLMVYTYQGRYEKITDTLNALDNYIENAAYDESLKPRERVDKLIAIGLAISEQHIDKPLDKVENNFSEQPFRMGLVQIIDAAYCCTRGNFSEALAVLSNLDYILSKRAHWSERLLSHIQKAIALFHLHMIDASMDELYKAYNMAYRYKIIIPFVQGGRLIMPVIESFRKQERYDIDANWLKSIFEEAVIYSKNVKKVSSAYLIDHGKGYFPKTKLTSREEKVLYYLVQGLTRDEIGREMNISINGVKKHLAKIYDKLGAKNRAEAIYIAMSNKDDNYN